LRDVLGLCPDGPPGAGAAESRWRNIVMFDPARRRSHL
jgi:hypothetical protein